MLLTSKAGSSCAVWAFGRAPVLCLPRTRRAWFWPPRMSPRCAQCALSKITTGREACLGGMRLCLATQRVSAWSGKGPVAALAAPAGSGVKSLPPCTRRAVLAKATERSGLDVGSHAAWTSSQGRKGRAEGVGGRKHRYKGRETKQQGFWLSRKPGGQAEPGEARGGEEEAREAGEGKATRALPRGCTASGGPGELVAAGAHLPSGARTRLLPVRLAGGSTHVFLHSPPTCSPGSKARASGPGSGLGGQRSGQSGARQALGCVGRTLAEPMPGTRGPQLPCSPAHPDRSPSLQMDCP